MQFLHPGDEQIELTYSDVFLMPRRSNVSSRMHTDLRPVENIGTTIPLIVSNMMTAAGRRMTETVTRRGGLVVLPQDMTLDRIQEIVSYVKQCHHVFETPVVLHESESVQTALNLIYKRSHGAVIVVDDAKRPVGVFTESDAYMKDKFISIGEVMTRDVVTVPEHANPREIFFVLQERRLSVVPVVDREGVLKGVLTKKGALRAEMYQPALNHNGQLMTSVAVGINADLEQRVRQLLDIGVDVIVLDTAHGHQEKMIGAIRQVRSMLGPHRPLVAGNIVSKQAAQDFIEAGANILKVGVGPGAMCTTRMMTGVGRPQFSAVHEVAKVARAAGVHVWADGGVKHPRDVALAIAAGASSVMIGSWWAGTFESPADIQKDSEGRMYKENYGMASRRAVENRNANRDPYEQARKQYFEEGISTGKMYVKPGQESAEDIIDAITAGLRSTCTYAGASNLEELYQNAVVGVQTAAGYQEGAPFRQGW